MKHKVYSLDMSFPPLVAVFVSDVEHKRLVEFCKSRCCGRDSCAQSTAVHLSIFCLNPDADYFSDCREQLLKLRDAAVAEGFNFSVADEDVSRLSAIDPRSITLDVFSERRWGKASRRVRSRSSSLVH